MKETFVLIFIIGLIIMPSDFVCADANEEEVSTECNVGGYDIGGPFNSAVSLVMETLISYTPQSQDYRYHYIYPGNIAFGHATCNTDLTSLYCGVCLAHARQIMVSKCDNSVGAHVVLVDCSMEYENYDFVGI